MSNVNANINVIVNTSQAVGQLRALQAQVNALNTSAMGVGAQASRMAVYNKALADAAVASGRFTSSIVPMSHSVENFSKHLDRGNLSLSQYSRGIMSQMPGMRRVFTREFDMMTKVAESRVKRIQTQYTALGATQKALALTPTALPTGMAAQTAIAAQKQMIMNKMISDGSTKLLNWGKNTQWAGRQLMVGFTMPLMIFGGVAAKTFMDLDKQARDFKRVYGDAFTPPAEIEQNLEAVKSLGMEYTKYGVKLQDTMNIAATAAAAGMRNAELVAGTEESLRLATIGQIDYQQALTTTISLQTAFKTSAEQLPEVVDFIGAVANQTVLTVDDMTKAIPRVAPVVAGLGGNIKDLAAMMVAMREGGVSAEQGANGLKSGLASLINPTKKAREALSKLGIDIEAIIQANRGDLMATIKAFGAALDTVDDFSRQQALEKVFGKYQYARLSALFDNINDKGSQAAVALDLAGKSAEELGRLSAKSLSEIEQSTTAKFQGAVERMKVAIAPVGEAFLKALTPIIEFISKIAEKFNELPGGVKDVITKIVAAIGIVAPVVLMLAGLFGNLVAQGIKGFQTMRKLFAVLKGDASAFRFLAGEELDAAAAARSLEGASDKLTNALILQEKAVNSLITLYQRLVSSAAAASGAMASTASAAAASAAAAPKAASVPKGPISFFTPMGRLKPPGKFAKGVTSVPGTGNGDTVPALLTPGESVVTKSATKKYGPIIAAMNAGTIQGFSEGGGVGASQSAAQSALFYTNRVFAADPSENTSKKYSGSMYRNAFSAPFAAMYANSFAPNDKTMLPLANTVLRQTSSLFGVFNRALEREIASIKQLTGKRVLTEAELISATQAAAKKTSAIVDRYESITGKKVLQGNLRRSAFAYLGINDQSAPLTTISRTGVRSGDSIGRGSLMLPSWIRKNGGTYEERSSMSYRTLPKQLRAFIQNETGARSMHLGHFQDPIKGTVEQARQAAMAAGSSSATKKIADILSTPAFAASMSGSSQSQVRSQGASATSSYGRGGKDGLGINSPSKVAKQTIGSYLQGVVEKTTEIKPLMYEQGYETQKQFGLGAQKANKENLAAAKAGAQQMLAALNSQSKTSFPRVSLPEITKRNGFFKSIGLAAGGTGKTFGAAATGANNMFSPWSAGSPLAKELKNVAGQIAQPYKQMLSDRKERRAIAKEERAARKAERKASKQSSQNLRSGGSGLVPQTLQRPSTAERLAARWQNRGNALRDFRNRLNETKNAFNNYRAERQSAKDRATAAKRAAATNANLYGLSSSGGNGAGQVIQGTVLSGGKNSGIEKYIAPPTLKERIINAFRSIGNAIKTGASTLVNETKNQIKNLKTSFGNIKSFFSGKAERNQRLAIEGPKSTALVTKMQKESGRIKTEFNRIVGILRSSGLKEAFAQAKIDTRGAFKQGAENVRAALSEVGTNIRSAGSAAARAISGIGIGAYASAAGAASNIGNKVKQWWTTAKVEGGMTGGQKVSQTANSAIMGLMGLSMAASFAGGSIGEMAQKVMPLTMGLMGLQMILPLFTNPLGLAIIAVTALVGAVVKARTDLDNLAKESARAGANIGGMADSMKIIEEATGFKAPSPEDYLFRFSEEDKAAQSKFAPYFETENGKRVISELQNATSEERLKRVRFMLAQAVGSGMNVKDAKAFGESIAVALGDSLLNSSIAADFANQFFTKGSKALLDLERQRMAEQPILGADWNPNSFNATQAKREQDLKTLTWSDFIPTANTATSNPLLTGANAIYNSIPGINIGKAIFDWVGANIMSALPGETFGEAATRKAAESMGYALQVIQDLSNAEAVLEDERRNALITYDEYLARQNELATLQSDATKYLNDVFSLGADADAMMQALGNELSFAGFSEDQIGRITKQFSPDALANEFFGMNFNDPAMTKAQKDYVTQVFQTTMSGLTPENIGQRLGDIESIWAKAKDEFLAAAEAGFTPDIKDIGSKVGLTEWINSSLGVPTSGPAGTPAAYNPAANAAQRLLDSENSIGNSKGLKELGTDAKELQIVLDKFKDTEYVRNILETRDGILSVGEAIVKLKKYEDINIELLSKSSVTPDELVSALEKMSKVKVNKGAMGIMLNPQTYANIGLELKNSGKEIEDSYIKMATNVQDSFIKAKANTKALKGDIKGVQDQLLLTKGGDFVVNTEFITTMWGKDVVGSEISTILQNAFPTGLDPIKLQIIMQAIADPATRAIIAANPEAFSAALKGEQTYTKTVGSVGLGGSGNSTSITENVSSIPLFGSISEQMSNSKGYSLGGQTFGGKDDKGGSGSKDDPVKDFMASIKETLMLYTNLPTLLNKLKNKKKKVEDLLGQIGFSNTLADQMRKANLNENLIANILSQGYENASKIWNGIRNKAGKTNKAFVLGGLGEQIGQLEAKKAADENRLAVKNKLMKSGKFTEDEVDEAIKDDELVNLLAQVKVGSKNWEEYETALRNALNASKAFEEQQTPAAKALEAFNETMDFINADFENKFAENEMFANLQYTAQYGETREQTQFRIEDNEKKIEGHREEIYAIEQVINALERRRGVDNDINTWGLERLQRRVEVLNQEIRTLERLNELDQRKIDKYQHEEKIRQESVSAINNELEIMSQKENEIKKAYDERIKALDTIAQINDHIINQQKNQLGLADALSRGDIAAAAAAQQDMQAADAQYATEQLRQGLQTGVENQIAGLTTADGLTREQAEAKLNEYKQQSYQVSLLINQIEEQIYQRNLNEILPLKNEQYDLETKIQNIGNQIWTQQQLILDIERNKIAPLERQNQLDTARISDLDKMIERQNDLETVSGKTKKEWEQISALTSANLAYNDLLGKSGNKLERKVKGIADQWIAVGDNINRARKAMTDSIDAANKTPLSEEYTEENRAALIAKAIEDYNKEKEAIMAAAIAEIGVGANYTKEGPFMKENAPSNYVSWTPGMPVTADTHGSYINPFTGEVEYFNAGGMVMKRYASGGVIGSGARDSVPAMLSPGEYVMRRAAVKKYGMATLERMNMGAFSMPRYQLARNALPSISRMQGTSIESPVYNTYSVNVNVPNTNADPDMIANKVMTKLTQIDSANIRSLRGIK